MDRAKFEALVRKEGFQPLQKIQLKDAELFIAERLKPGDLTALEPVDQQAHFDILWALARKGASIGQPITLSAIRFPFQDQRIKIVRSRAENILRMLVKSGPKFVERS